MKDIIINTLASIVYSLGIGLLEKAQFAIFKRKLKKWLKEFCKKNEGSILLTGHFEKFLIYHKPVEAIFSFILEPADEFQTEDDFLREIVDKFKEVTDVNISVLDESITKELFSKLLENLKEYLRSHLSVKDRFIVHLIKQNSIKSNEVADERYQQMIHLISSTSNNYKISNDKCAEVYDAINDSLMSGDINLVRNIVPVIENKNDDLENAIKINLTILSNHHLLTKTLLETFSGIKCEKIKEDLCRKLILHYIDDKKALSQLLDIIANPDLKQIIECLIASQKLYTETVQIENHIPVHTFNIEKNYDTEKWLVNRICFFDIHNKFPSFDATNLLQEKQTFVDKLFVFDAKHLKLLSYYSEEKTKDAEILLNELKSLEPIYTLSSNKIKTKYYEILLRLLSIFDNEEVLSYATKLPVDIINSPDISAIVTGSKIELMEISEEDVIKICYSSEHYSLLDFYLYKNNYDDCKQKELLGNNRNLIKHNFGLFMRYTQVVNRTDGTANALCVMEQFKDDHYDKLEYHILSLWIDDSDIEKRIDSVFKLWQKNELQCGELKFELEFSRMLLNIARYKEAQEVLSKLEALGYRDKNLPLFKAHALIEQEKNIDGLNILLDNFKMYKDNEQVIDMIITISLDRHRNIPEEVIDCALKIGTPRMRLLVAHAKSREDKQEEAQDLVKQALLSSANASDFCEAYMFFFTQNGSNKNADIIKDVDVNRMVLLNNNQNQTRVYCIYRNGFLDNEPLLWEDAVHISEDTAISMRLLKKAKGEQITVDNLQYTIVEILPIDAYFFKVCSKKMTDKGTAKVFSVETLEDHIVNMDGFVNWLKENAPSNDVLNEFIKKYMDLNQTPVPLYLIHKCSKGTYLETILAFIDDNSIAFREIMHNGPASENGYILSTAAMIALYKLGVDSAKLPRENLYIADSLVVQIETDIQKIIEQNKQEHNISMGVLDDNLFIQEVTAEEKQSNMQDAVNIKKYTKSFKVLANNSDMSLNGIDCKLLRDGLGICDYDAISIAMTNNMKLIGAEAPIIGLSAYLKQNTACLLDFLCEINLPLIDLIMCMIEMVKHNFHIIITPNARDYIFDEFQKLDCEQEKIFSTKFNEYFEKIETQSDEYKKICMPLINTIFYSVETRDCSSPALTRLISYHLMKLNDLKVELITNEEGKIEVKLFKSTDV